MLVGAIGSTHILIRDGGWSDGPMACLPMAPVVAAFAERAVAAPKTGILTSFLFHMSWLLPPHIMDGWVPEGRRTLVHIMKVRALRGVGIDREGSFVLLAASSLLAIQALLEACTVFSLQWGGH